MSEAATFTAEPSPRHHRGCFAQYIRYDIAGERFSLADGCQADPRQCSWVSVPLASGAEQYKLCGAHKARMFQLAGEIGRGPGALVADPHALAGIAEAPQEPTLHARSDGARPNRQLGFVPKSSALQRTDGNSASGLKSSPTRFRTCASCLFQETQTLRRSLDGIPGLPALNAVTARMLAMVWQHMRSAVAVPRAPAVPRGGTGRAPDSCSVSAVHPGYWRIGAAGAGRLCGAWGRGG